MNTVPVSIHNHFFTADSFVETINAAYGKTRESDQGFPADFKYYIHRNHCPTYLKPLLGITYSNMAPGFLSGLNYWKQTYSELSHHLAKSYSSKDYLQDILVEKLKNYIEEIEGDTNISCKDYKEYVQKCISLNYSPQLDLRWHDQRGWGVYAKEKIYPFMFIGLYTGRVIPTSLIGLIEKVRGYQNKYIWLLSYNNLYSVDAEKYGNYTRFINHDIKNSKRICTFSIQIAQGDEWVATPHRGFIVSDKDMEGKPTFDIDEELLWNYGPNYYISNAT